MIRKSLILGGARSGKTRRAQELADSVAQHSPGARKVYLATGVAGDREMEERIAKHQAMRDDSWVTLEVPLDLPQPLRDELGPDDIVVVDCLTLWLSNLLAAERDIAAEINMLAEATTTAVAHLIFVSNEVGHGIVPDNALARAFRDMQGLTNQQMAATVDHVELVVAGLVMQLKP